MNIDASYAPTAAMADAGRARASVPFLASRWVQAPIPVRREADT